MNSGLFAPEGGGGEEERDIAAMTHQECEKHGVQGGPICLICCSLEDEPKIDGWWPVSANARGGLGPYMQPEQDPKKMGSDAGKEGGFGGEGLVITAA